MLRTRGYQNSVTTNCLRYICPQCRFSALLAALLPPQRRSFHTRNRQQASLETSKPSIDSIHDIPSRFNSDTSIRKHLREWGAALEVKKKQEAEKSSGDAHALARLAVLPNSLYTEEPAPSLDEDADHENVPDEFFDPFDPGEGRPMPAVFQPGDLLWWYPGNKQPGFGQAQLVVFLHSTDDESHYLGADGRWLVELTHAQSSPAVPGFASQEEVESIRKHLPVKPLQATSSHSNLSLAYSFTGDVPAAVANPLVHRFAKFVDDMATWRRENMSLLDSLYDHVAEEDTYKSVSFEVLVEKLTGTDYCDVPPAALITIYRTIQRKLTGVIAMRRRIESPTITVSITPKNLANRFDQICEWTREYQECAANAAMGGDVSRALEANPLSAFIAKARRLILKSRTHRSPTTAGRLGPSSVQAGSEGGVPRVKNDEEFDENDRMFIEFLWDCFVRSPAPTNGRNTSIASLILRAIGAYPKLRLDRQMGCLLLQELGTLPPWYQKIDHDVGKDLPFGKGNADLKRLYQAADHYCHEVKGMHSYEDLDHLDDSMASLRQDLGNLPVYCIDTSSTLTREDGFSIEPHPELPGTYWLHGHVAHLSAYIDPNDIIAQRARRLLGTIAHHNRAVPMVPAILTKSLSFRTGKPALTVSTLINETGDVLDVKIRPTTIRNVIWLDSSAVEHLLGKEEAEYATLTVGDMSSISLGPSEPHRREDFIEKARKYLPDIKLMEKLVLARDKWRKQQVKVVPNWGVEINILNHRTSSLYGGFYSDDDILQSKQYQGDPIVTLASARYTKRHPISDLPSICTVTDLLGELVSESAGKWFGDRKLPAIFYGNNYVPNFPPERLNKAKRGETMQFPRRLYGSSPVPKVTRCMKTQVYFGNSLRRYADLIALWNADCYLKAEANGLVEPGQPGDKLELPFSKQMVEDYITHEIPRAYGQLAGYIQAAIQHWYYEAMFRAFHFKEVELPEIWDMHILSLKPISQPDDTGLRGVLLPFPLQATLLASEEGWEKNAGRFSFLPVKLELVDIAHRKVMVRAVGPPSDTHTQPGPIQLMPNKSSLSTNG